MSEPDDLHRFREGLTVLAAHHLAEVVAYLRGEGPLDRANPAPTDALEPHGDDLADVRGQAVARRGIEVAAAGGHHILFVGPPGVGKSMLARRLPGILPPLEPEEAITVTRLHSGAGLRPPGRGPDARTTISRAASFTLACGADRRRLTTAPGRAVVGTSWRVVPGRAGRVPASPTGRFARTS